MPTSFSVFDLIDQLGFDNEFAVFRKKQIQAVFDVLTDEQKKEVIDKVGSLNYVPIEVKEKESEPVIWSMYKEPDNPNDIFGDEDTATDVPDGKYPLYVEYQGKRVGLQDGVLIQNGHFDIEHVCNVTQKLRDQVGYWGAYLEDLKWDSETKSFEACVGS